MNIIHFSTLNRGGAAQAVYRMHKNILKNGYKSLFLVNSQSGSDSSVIEVNNNRFDYHRNVLLQRIEDYLHLYDKDYCFFDRQRYSIENSEKIIKKIDLKPDAIFLHWISKFVNLKVIKELQDYYKVPVYWYLMDMAPFTGGCHYAWDCNGYKTSCENCPAILKKCSKKIATKTLNYKSRILSQMEVEILSPTSLLTEQSRSSLLFKGLRTHFIPIAVDKDIFKPMHKAEVRSKHNISLDKKVIYFVTSNIHERRKGYQYLKEALIHLSKSADPFNIIIVTAGATNKVNELFAEIDITHHHLGYLRGDIALAEAYNISDVFVSPSIEDSGPMMVNESMMCGVPVASFKMGVALDLVEDGVTGYKVELRNSKALATSIIKILSLNGKEYSRMSMNCRNKAIEILSQDIQIKKVVEILA